MAMCCIINDINKLGTIFLALRRVFFSTAYPPAWLLVFMPPRPCDATQGTFWRKGASPMKNSKKHIFRKKVQFFSMLISEFQA